MEQQSSSRGDGDQSSSSSFRQLWAKWSSMLGRVYDDPRVARVTQSKVGQYLHTHPYAALTAILFGAMAAVPVGLFLTFALVTVVLSAAGFVFCEGALLLAAGLILLSVLGGLAFFAVLLSFILHAFYFISSSTLKYYSVKKQQRKVEEETDEQTSYEGEHED